MDETTTFTVSQTKNLPSSRIGVKLLQKIDLWLREELPKAAGQEDVKLTRSFDIVNSANLTRHYPGVEFFKEEQFPNNTVSARLLYENNDPKIRVSVSFAVRRDGTTIELSVERVASEQMVVGIIDRVVSIVDEQSQSFTTIPFKYPWVAIILLTGMIFGLPFFGTHVESYPQPAKAVLWCIFLGLSALYILGCIYTPYSRFDTPRNDELDKMRWFFTTGFVGWILFSVAAGFLLQKLVNKS